jgi:hypothetical protein
MIRQEQAPVRDACEAPETAAVASEFEDVRESEGSVSDEIRD